MNFHNLSKCITGILIFFPRFLANVDLPLPPQPIIIILLLLITINIPHQN